MKMTLTVSQFRDEFRRAGRADQFSYEALGLIFDYFENLEPDYDLDVIEICCEFAEATPDEITQNNSLDTDPLEFLEDNTSVVGVTPSGTIVYQQF